jgi:branched-chain amino acid transport system ATP-binding protein
MACEKKQGDGAVSNSILSTVSLNRQFSGVHATRDVSIEVPAGQIRAIIGPNGAGKTTLFNLLTGYLKANSGSMYFKGRDVTGETPHELSRRGFARTFQIPNVASQATVLENVQLARVSLGRGLWRLSARFDKMEIQRSKEVLSLVGLDDRAGVQGRNLAFGDQKKLELAIALACDPEILFLDEPTAGMPLHERPGLMQLVQSIVRARGLTTILIEHDMDLIFSVADQVTVLHRGGVVAEGTPDEVRANAEVQRIYLGEGTAAALGKTRTDRTGSTVLSVEGLTAGYGQGMVLHDVSLSVNEGEVVCLLGRNGAGKTTTIKSIMGLVAPAQGRITLRGENVVGRPTYEICRAGIGYVPEDRRIFPDLTVLENLEVGREAAGHSDSAVWTLERVMELFAPLHPLRHQRAKHLSGGEQRMLTIARALLGNPKVLLLDEPSEGLAPLVVQALWGHIRALKEAGLAILLSEQNLWFASGLSTRVYIIDKGQIQLNSTFAELEANPELKRMHLSL